MLNIKRNSFRYRNSNFPAHSERENPPKKYQENPQNKKTFQSAM